MRQGTGVGLWPVARAKQWALVQQTAKEQIRPHHAQHLGATLQQSQLRGAQNPDPQKLQDNYCVLF